MDFYEIREKLQEAAEEKYREFNAKIVPTAYPMLGVRVPALKKLAAQADAEYLEVQPKYYEEVFLHGLVLAKLCPAASSLFPRLPRFLERADNWAVIDSPVIAMKAFKKDRAACFEKLKEYALDKREYFARFAAVAALAHYADAEYADRVIQMYSQIPAGRYYVDMAVAWGLSVLAVKQYEKAMAAIRSGTFSPDVCCKALSKCVDSYRITDGQKDEIRRLRKQIKAENMK